MIDNFKPDFTPEVVLFPVGGPFMALREAIDYIKEVSPSVAIPMHEEVLSSPGHT